MGLLESAYSDVPIGWRNHTRRFPTPIMRSRQWTEGELERH